MSQGRRLSRDERREELLNVARRMFGKKGYRRTEVNDVVRAAGVTRPILYRHFPGGKREVFLEVLKEHLDFLLVELFTAMTLGSDPRDRLRRGIDAYLGFAESDPDGFELMLSSTDALDHEVGATIKDFRDRVLETLTETIGEIMSQSGLAVEGAEVYANALLGGVESVGLYWVSTKDFDRSSVVSYLLAFFWRGFDGLPREPTRFVLPDRADLDSQT